MLVIQIKFTSDCQKYCENCLIFYIGCRYCLMTNIICGITSQSQYKNIDKYFCPNTLFNSIYCMFHNNRAEILMEWIPYSQFTNVKEIAKGGFGIIYQATWLDGSTNNKINYSKFRERRNNEIVILKKFNDSQATGCKPFANVEHDTHLVYKILDGERTEITKYTPECYANLMKRCCNANPKKRPHNRNSVNKFKETWSEFNKKPHPSAIYTSRPLRSFISRNSLNSSKDYTSIELDPNILGTKRNIEELGINSYGNSGIY
ncbi:hypothetical protein RhiirA4_468404 [Rhizophagus irregularis]|uniref:Protein kinase domain-containing protein n=1 Tax=Rhizophagus irregularis TaxID=588596 RepID=A0A2I1GXY7_9GLOM|nr:hypothetical protein RhiirA4_468404 [Rhizophagus irregularis]